MLQGDVSELCRLSSDWICLCADGQGNGADRQSEETGHSEGRAPGNGKNYGEESGRRVALMTVTYGLYNHLTFAFQWSKALCRCYKCQTIPFLKINPLSCMGIILLSGGAEPRDTHQLKRLGRVSSSAALCTILGRSWPKWPDVGWLFPLLTWQSVIQIPSHMVCSAKRRTGSSAWLISEVLEASG